MSMAHLLLFRRHRDRMQSELVANNADHEEDDEEGSFVNQTTTSTTADGTNTSIAPAVNNDADREEQQQHQQQRAEEATESDNEDGDEDEYDDDSNIAVAETEGINRYSFRPETVSLAELEEEREMARRRSSACLLFALFVLFRLWVLALQDGDFGLLLVCLVGTSWTARWIRYNRDQEEELDRRIASYLEQQNNNSNGNGSSDHVGRDDLRMLSFQAQLALAIMESQRQMMQGGYGHPDGGDQATPGVSDQAKTAWSRFQYQSLGSKEASKRSSSSYGSVAAEDPLKTKGADSDAPHCSICLGEYENGEHLTKLPCKHMYHDECIDSWCSNHTRCPLCNLDLETEGTAAGTASVDEIV